jgi:hypothetical protein
VSSSSAFVWFVFFVVRLFGVVPSLCFLRFLLGNSAGVVAGLGEAGPTFAKATAGRPGSTTPATSFFPSKARRVLPWGRKRTTSTW